MSWISKNLTLDLLAIAIDGLTKSFDRIKSEPESDWPPAEVPTAAQPAVEPPAPVEQPQPEPTPEPQPAAQESAPEPAAAPPATVDRHAEAQAHLTEIAMAGHRDWILQTLLPSFGASTFVDFPAEHLPALIDKAVAYKLEKGLG